MPKFLEGFKKAMSGLANSGQQAFSSHVTPVEPPKRVPKLNASGYLDHTKMPSMNMSPRGRAMAAVLKSKGLK